jgi:hypothetical protein
MTIRAFVPGDEVAQVGIYNEAAGDLPKFKPATVDEVRRRCLAPDFDPSARFFALDEGRPVGYAGFHANGRVSFPWCRKGYERFAEPLLGHVLDAMKARGMARAFAAYRGDWPAQCDFFRRHGFAPAREMVNFVIDLVELPTPSARAGGSVSPLTPADVPAVWRLGGNVFRARTPAELEAHLFRNRHFPPEAVFAQRGSGGPPVAVGVLVADPAYAHPRQVDPAMPCFRLGAFGTEGMQVKRINGLFSFLAPADRTAPALALELLAHATMRLYDTDVETLAAQVPSDAPHLLHFYKQTFERQGSFPVFEKELLGR